MQAEIVKIQKEMLQKVYENVFACFHICIGNDGYHLPNVILKQNLYRVKWHTFHIFLVYYSTLYDFSFWSYNHLKWKIPI